MYWSQGNIICSSLDFVTCVLYQVLNFIEHIFNIFKRHADGSIN
jgi:hypothetical protein